MPSLSSFSILPLIFQLILVVDEASSFAFPAVSWAQLDHNINFGASSTSSSTCRRRSALRTTSTAESISTSVFSDNERKHAVVGSTQLHPQPRPITDFPTLHQAYMTNSHPSSSNNELQQSNEQDGYGTFLMRDWRKAWYTYGQCDTSITPEECNDYTSSLHASSSNDKIEEGNEKQMVVNPFTGEANYEITEVDGTLPDDLVGVLYRNGPGKFGINGERVAHILDADGLVVRFEFPEPGSSITERRVKFTSRFVETEGFIEENAAKQFLKRGTFGTAPRGLQSMFGEPKRIGLNADPEENPPLLSRMAANAFHVDIKNTANTQVIAFGGKVLAFWEAGLPYALDPVTLKTLGMDYVGGPKVSQGKLPVNYVPGLPKDFQPDILGGRAHTAHPKMCPRTGHLVGWTWAQNPMDGSMEVTFTEYDSDGFRVVASKSHVLEGVALAPHDMVLTENYIMLTINALTMDQLSFLSGAKGPAESLGMDGRALVRAFVFPRPTKDRSTFAPFVVNDIPACFSIHFSHGYEDEKTGNIVSYFSGWPPNDSKTFLGAWGGFCPDYHQIPVTNYWRMEIDPSTQRCVDLRVSPGSENVCCEHPVVHPNVQTKDAAFTYAQCCNVVGDSSAPLGYAKLRVDGSARAQPFLKAGERNEAVDVYWVGPRRFAGEPLVVPKRNGNLDREQDAYLLGLVYDAVKDQSSLMIFDLERELKDGPVCTLWLKTAMPHGLHGCFASDTSVKTSCFC